ncbi:DUF3090 family protein [Arsenicicoccus piscis]|uniref:DUF3090 family protein n=1 Tax=Arsenicicoccus piscis TaxID=673954 RepID=UPI001F4D0DCC|nr:DUF3090 family protein [Arsenicicoccus piscis]MCH8629281.1 DUF3090 family protein [Arsenicicoccus piscis]
MVVQSFESPERFVAGTVGPPGQRVFFLQARSGRRLVSVSLEKQQVAALADQVNDTIDAFAPTTGSESAAERFADNGPLDTPIEDEFRASALRLYWDPEQQVLVIEAADEDFPEDPDVVLEDAEDAPGQVIRVTLSAAQARAFARRSQHVVAGGRAPCPFCGLPLDPVGHICPRANGYRR